MNKLKKIEIAKTQLETALDLYFRNCDLVSVLTLAGAAEEILGICLRIKGIPSSLDETIEATCRIHEKFHKVRPTKKEFIERANRAKNHFKHLNSEEDLEITIDLQKETADMLDRAITNFWRLNEDLTENMVRFENIRKNT